MINLTIFVEDLCGGLVYSEQGAAELQQVQHDVIFNEITELPDY